MTVQLPATKDWIVRGVRPGKVSDNPHGGQLQAYYVDFDGMDDGTYWRRKAGNEPQKGEVFYGTITDGDYGPRFTLEKKPEGHVSPSGSADYAPRFNGKSPDQQASIVRQHSQDMAIHTLALFGKRDPAEDPMKVKELIRQWTDYFEADANAASSHDAANKEAPKPANGAEEKKQPAGSSAPAQALEDEFEAKPLGDEADIPF